MFCPANRYNMTEPNIKILLILGIPIPNEYLISTNHLLAQDGWIKYLLNHWCLTKYWEKNEILHLITDEKWILSNVYACVLDNIHVCARVAQYTFKDIKGT